MSNLSPWGLAKETVPEWMEVDKVEDNMDTLDQAVLVGGAVVENDCVDVVVASDGTGYAANWRACPKVRPMLRQLLSVGGPAAPGSTRKLTVAHAPSLFLGLSTNPYSYPYGDGKNYDCANFGVFQQNWGILRVRASVYGL
ncbi:uncharacterized protein P174DRAFT_424272 [Aspergillus novofumigatus IBT 16806]|uniref:Uncharacterized protein n=1 Tax=Aspergillus novofumigatus (strain IBT 16806) TaxID=1392255 RepID=A0A2I1BXG8_ASPN1|nr:uncharacterized protein P174DRAFT_424272 [Aspergillus novofumigatus IBT 16806]PKX90075.1 hypothetical protein P174DRAFT_424272 [Aspergillus novofumigatus IBT 16806]